MMEAGDKLIKEGGADDDRTTAQGLFNYADGYLGSAHALYRTQVNVIFPNEAVRFLLYHAAELYLKAFLRCTGISVSDRQLKGHRFTRLLPAARLAGLELDKGVEGVLRYGSKPET